MEESLKKFILYTAPSGEVRVDVFSTTAAHPPLIQAKTKNWNEQKKLLSLNKKRNNEFRGS
jgi:hypothetical protein